MKNVLLLLSIVIFLPLMNFAAIPIPANKTAKEVKKEIPVGKTIVKKKDIKKMSFFKRQILKRISKKSIKNNDNMDEVPIFNILSISLGFLGLAALIGAAFAASLALVYLSIFFGLAALVLGIVGLVRKERLTGLGISGIVMGVIGFLISLLVALIAEALE